MEHNFKTILTNIHQCYVPKLNEPYDTRQDTSFDFHNNTICQRLTKLHNVIAESGMIVADNAEYKLDLVSSLLILLEELRVSGAWCTEESKLGAETLKETVSNSLGYDLYDLLKNSKHDFSNITIFEECLKKLHLKLTSKDWKFYPSLMQVYIKVVHWTKLYCITPTNLPLTCPATLLFLDDFSTDNKIFGLQCLYVIIERIDRKKHENSGYELVILDVLLKHIRIKDVSILEMSLQCIIKLLPLIMSSDEDTFTQWSKNDDVLEIILYDVYVESDNQRKAAYFKHLPKLMSLHNYRCIRWKKKMVEILSHELGLCVSPQHNDLLLNCLLTLEACISYCWPVFSFKMDNCILKILLKIVYVKCLEVFHDEAVLNKITEILRGFLALCSESEREIFFKDYYVISNEIKNHTFDKYWKKIKEDYHYSNV